MASLVQILTNRTIHRQVLLLSIPMVLSNITIPLLGLVDAAVIGHLQHAWYLGGVALGGMLISVSFWLLGFLRMSTTGLTAQAYGADDRNQLALVWVQGVLMSLGFAAVFLLLHRLIGEGVFALSEASEQVKHYAQQYFMIRAWSAPAVLINFVLLGWLLGTQNAKAPMWMVIITNLTNIVLDVLFVLGFGWKVSGVALASVIADYLGMAFGLWCVWRFWRAKGLPSPWALLLQSTQGMSRFVRLNRDIFLRSLCLQAAFSFMTFQGAAFGDQVVAANAVLMSFLMMISYGMDGFAYAIEAMVGKAVGAKSPSQLKASIIGSTFWSLLICLGLTAVFAFSGSNLIGLITSIPSVQQTAQEYLPWLVAMPLVAMWCFLLDGIFIGATKGREMRNSMFIAASGFFLVFILFSVWQNHALWLAMLTFMALRGLSLGWVLKRQWQRGDFL
ncbi:MATE family efflux transporter DinF [Vibrio metschnikovii]|uniref:MATE family efflux transporter DinF n=1 Tax=Vibrio TaxID=662 RepID=UPI001482F6B4|nr:MULTISPECIES: MATE family efflux transporter DinF [Vibrio]NNN61690.1 MATE family efflux transporter DinF [Vibrio sp. A11]EKO3566743.1 MATE family efflux transporter DinF [Vibrio metschnikovii]EKO3579635.1 MATE family efflux transporter DinF [Vibrio metschnikovii]EKO3583279.1 MATE family efflux transporter DinF [Vibrio metschnikovii]EKO3628774.1 MATE family efflux transporter DinF [Vibrio metschnikovii]